MIEKRKGETASGKIKNQDKKIGPGVKRTGSEVKDRVSQKNKPGYRSDKAKRYGKEPKGITI